MSSSTYAHCFFNYCSTSTYLLCDSARCDFTEKEGAHGGAVAPRECHTYPLELNSSSEHQFLVKRLEILPNSSGGVAKEGVRELV